jgi:hypothetical protein
MLLYYLPVLKLSTYQNNCSGTKMDGDGVKVSGVLGKVGIHHRKERYDKKRNINIKTTYKN